MKVAPVSPALKSACNAAQLTSVVDRLYCKSVFVVGQVVGSAGPNLVSDGEYSKDIYVGRRILGAHWWEAEGTGVLFIMERREWLV